MLNVSEPRPYRGQCKVSLSHSCSPLVGQGAQWRTHHKRICKIFNSYTSSIKYQALQTHERYDSILLSHVVAQMSLLPNAYASEDSTLCSVLLSLLPGPQHLVDSVTYPHVCPIKPPPSTDLLRNIYMRFGNNNFAIHSHLTTIGHGVFPIASRLFNHSCTPNAAAKYTLSPTQSVIMDVVALREIPPGEEVCISKLASSYLPLMVEIRFVCPTSIQACYKLANRSWNSLTASDANALHAVS